MSRYRLVRWYEKVKGSDQYSYCEGNTPDLDGNGWPGVEGRNNGAVGDMYNLPLFIARLKFNLLYHGRSKPPFIRRMRNA